MADEEHHHEIIVVHRHGDHEDAHHGGVWKIAFADFMTAMMAFFLVMWLISANDKTKATIASYFNPVKLVDTTTQPKGLEDAKAVESVESPKKGSKSVPIDKPAGATPDAPVKPEAAAKAEAEAKAEAAAKAENGAKAGGNEESASKAKDKRLAAAMIDDPYAALTEIAGQKGSGEKSLAAPVASENIKVMPRAISHKGGDAFRDPFAPPPPMQPDVLALPSETPEADPKKTAGGGDPDLSLDVRGKGQEGQGGKDSGSDSPDSAKAVKPEALAAGKAAAAQIANARAAEIKTAITGAAKSAGLDKLGPRVEVRNTDEGILISLTDDADFEMFSTGSTVPGKKVVLMVDKIAQVLKAKPGKIVIRGFTDNRPYKSGHYDNWRLSADRAQVMHYMLVRGGFDENRIARIEGYADRNPKNPADPANAVNRRIEILLRESPQ